MVRTAPNRPNICSVDAKRSMVVTIMKEKMDLCRERKRELTGLPFHRQKYVYGCIYVFTRYLTCFVGSGQSSALHMEM